MAYLKHTSIITMLILMATPSVLACMPHSPEDVFIGRVQAIKPITTDNQTQLYDYKFSSHNFVFRSPSNSLQYTTAELWQSDIAPKKIYPNDLVIGLAYNANGNKPANYTVSTLASLDCTNDTLSIGQSLSHFVAWDRAANHCLHYGTTPIEVLDGFFEHNQDYYLQKLQIKYPTCDVLATAFPTHTSSQASVQIGTQIDSASIVIKEATQENKIGLWGRLKVWIKSLFS